METITVVAVTVSVILSAFSVLISLKNRRNALREKVFEKQFDMYMEFSEKAALIDTLLTNLNTKYSNNKETTQHLFNQIQGVDHILTKSEIIIPDDLYKSFNEFMNYCNDRIIQIMEKPEEFLNNEKKEFIKRIFDFEMEIRDYIAIDKLSEENRKLAKNRISL